MVDCIPTIQRLIFGTVLSRGAVSVRNILPKMCCPIVERLQKEERLPKGQCIVVYCTSTHLTTGLEPLLNSLRGMALHPAEFVVDVRPALPRHTLTTRDRGDRRQQSCTC